MRKQLVSWFFFLFTIYVSGQNSDKPDFYPPLKLKPVVSGTFGEIRTNHFHSGLDLSTSGKTGYRVYSSGDGFVSRIKVSPVGYGKAIYIQHPDGYTTVYGHLLRFSHRIDSLVVQRQYEKHSYSVDLFFKKNEIPVKKGEVIAYSGNTGSSAGPHLHYEVRETATQKPLDPLLFRHDVPDDIRPRIQGLKVYPIDTNSRVEGKCRPKYLQTVYYDNLFHPKGQRIIKASGEVGLGIQVLDYFSGSWRKCGVRSVELYVDSQRVFEADYSTFSFAETRYVNSLMDYAEKKRSGKVIQKSFVDPNNRLSIYKDLKNKGIIDLKPGDKVNVRYVVKDAAGNESDLTFVLQGVSYPNEEPAADENDGTAKIAWDKPFEFSSNGVSVKFSSRSFYTDVPFYFGIENDSAGFLSPVYVIGDADIPVHKYFDLSIVIPDSLNVPEDKLVVAGVTLRGKPFYAGGKVKDGEITARVRDFGRYTLYYDTIAPVIRLYRAPSAYNYKGRKTISARITDNLSGIKSYNCYIDDKWVLFEYDAKSNKITGYKDHFPSYKSGKKELRIEVVDNCGNKSVKKYNITL